MGPEDKVKIVIRKYNESIPVTASYLEDYLVKRKGTNFSLIRKRTQCVRHSYLYPFLYPEVHKFTYCQKVHLFREREHGGGGLEVSSITPTKSALVWLVFHVEIYHVLLPLFLFLGTYKPTNFSFVSVVTFPCLFFPLNPLLSPTKGYKFT